MAAPNPVTTFLYFKWEPLHEREKPYVIYMDVPDGVPSRNFTLEPGPPETVHDIRPHVDDFTLDRHGFEIRRQPLGIDDFSPQAVESRYLPTLETLLREALGAECRIVWFDWRLRSGNKSKTDLPAGTKVDLEDRLVYLTPVRAAHVDQSRQAAVQRVYHHMGADAEALLKKRVRIINLWRPIRGPVESYPLAYCDGSTVPPDRLVSMDVVRSTYVGESYNLLPHEGYRWHYLSGQTRDEVVLMKMYDSSEDVEAWCCPHASFPGDEAPTAAMRESIEARALVFTES